MSQSEQINELAAALAKAQGEIKNPAKTKTASVQMRSGGSYKFDYADFNGVTEAAKHPLTDNGLAVTQEAEDMRWCITTVFHMSGQWKKTIYPIIIPAQKDRDGNEIPITSQVFAAAFTYAKRNAYCALLCIAAGDDDDANLSDGNTAKINAKQKYGTTPADVHGEDKVKYDMQGQPVDNIPFGEAGIEKLNVKAMRGEYAELSNDIRKQNVESELIAWGKKNANRVQTLSPDWQEHLRNEYADKLDELRGA